MSKLGSDFIRNCVVTSSPRALMLTCLTHWGRVTHICVSKLTIIDSNNGLLPDRRQVIIWTNAGLLLIGPSGTNFSEISIKIYTFSFKKMRLKVSFAKRQPSCLGLNVLTKIRAWIRKHTYCLNSSPPGHNGHHFTDDIFRCIFENEKFVFWFKFHWSLFIRGLIDNMAWLLTVNKPLPEPMMTLFTNTYMRH